MSNPSSLPIFRIKILLICLLPFFNCKAQKLNGELSGILESTRIKIPTDKLFLHTDRNLYRPGDSIYFQSYIEDRFTQKLETSSLSSWVLLLNPEGETIDSARLRIDYSTAPGWLAIPKDCLPGWYRIKAFTSRMQNYDPHYAFSQWIRVDELIKENVSIDYLFNRKGYDSKDTVEVSITFEDENGEPLKNTDFSYSTIIANKSISTYRSKTTRKGQSLLRIYLPDSLNTKNVRLDISLEKGFGEYQVDIPRKAENPAIQFLPEGGTYVSGYLQKMAFNAVSSSGEQLYLNGLISDERGNFIDSIKSGPFGPGLVQFTPETGRQYHAEFPEYPNKKWPLPEISETYPSIQVKQAKSTVIVDVSGGLMQEQYYLALTKNYNITAFIPFSVNKQKRIKFNTDALPPGMARITLFTNELKPIAERTIYIPRVNEPNFILSSEFEFYYTEQQTALDIEIQKGDTGRVSGLFSIAVVDSSTALHAQLNLRNIEDEFLFEEEFYKRLPLHIKQSGLSNLSRNELDIVLMTYGWTRFNWSDPAKTKPFKKLNYDQYKIDITEVHSARKRKKIDNSGDPLSVFSLEDQSIINILKERSSSYIFDLDSVSPFTKNIMLVPNVSVKRMVNAAKVEPVLNTTYFNSFANENEQAELNTKLPLDLMSEPVINLDNFRLLQDISVYAKREPAKKFVNEYEKHYQGLSTRTIDQQIIQNSFTLESLLYKLFPYRLDTQDQKIYLRPPSLSKSGPALFVLDGIPVGKDYQYLIGLPTDHIHSITAIFGVGGYYIFGKDAVYGVVFVETIFNHFGDEYELPQKNTIISGDLRKIIQLFRPNQEFYNPPKEVILNDPEYWVRPTLFWSPEVFYDGNKTVRIEYYNHQKKGTVYILVNGVTSDGEPISGIHKYKLK